MIRQVKGKLKHRFEMTDSGACKFVLGIELIEHGSGIILCQRRYIRDILKRFRMENCTPVPSPVNVSLIMTKGGVTYTTIHEPYREAVGALMHLVCATRHDIGLVVGMVA